MKPWSMVLLPLCLVACGSSHTPAAPLPPTPPAATYYVGTSQAFVGEQQVADSAVAVERLVSRGDRTIIERVAQAGDGHRPAAEYVVTMKVKGAAFTMTEAGGAFTGDGQLSGPDWAWTAWQSTSKMPDGGVVTSSDTVTKTGLHVEKTYQGNGMELRMVEELQVVPEADYRQRRSEILSHALDG